MARKEYDTFLTVSLEEGEVDITVRELTPDNPRRKYRNRKVKARISKSEIPDGDILHLRTAMSSRALPEGWYIKILEG